MGTGESRLPVINLEDETVWRIYSTGLGWSWKLVEDKDAYERARARAITDLDDVVYRDFENDLIRRVVLIKPSGTCAQYLIVAAKKSGPPTGAHLLELLLDYRGPVCSEPQTRTRPRFPHVRPPHAGRGPSRQPSVPQEGTKVGLQLQRPGETKTLPMGSEETSGGFVF